MGSLLHWSYDEHLLTMKLSSGSARRHASPGKKSIAGEGEAEAVGAETSDTKAGAADLTAGAAASTTGARRRQTAAGARPGQRRALWPEREHKMHCGGSLQLAMRWSLARQL